MPAGFSYDFKGDPIDRELWAQDTTYRLSGGFNLVDSDIDMGVVLPSLAPLSVDFDTRKAVVVKNVQAQANINAEELKIKKNSLIKVGMHIGNGTNGATISAIDKSNENYDALTLSATIAGVKAGDVLFEATAAGGKNQKNTTNFLNYARVKVEDGATITAVGQAYEIKTKKLYLPISEADKTSLGHRFMFV